jgi:hypothetical protein
MIHMQGPKKIADAGKKAGKKVLATDTAQGVAGAVVDKLEEIAVDKADDMAATAKQKVAKAGGRSPTRSTSTKSGAKKSSGRKKATAKKSTGRKKATAKTSSGRKKATAKTSAGRKKATAKKSTGRKKATAKKR